MEQYINKSALVAEIERRIKRFREEKDSVSIVKTNTYKGILSFIDTLEVKEVDLEYLREELDKAVKIYKPGGNFGWGTLYNIAEHIYMLDSSYRFYMRYYGGELYPNEIVLYAL